MLLSQNRKMGKEEMCSIKDKRAVSDAMEALSGKWKVKIILSVVNGNKRFKDIGRDIPGISDRMLSKELKDLEINKLVERKIYDSFPPVVEYLPTEHTYTLREVIECLKKWGFIHRDAVLGG